jgi:DNA-binding XRE family transcriptional regulator
VQGAQENYNVTISQNDIDNTDTLDALDTELRQFLVAVGQRILKVREFRNMSRKELGEAIGSVGASANTTVYAIEMNGAGTRISTIYKIARVLDVSPGFLLDGGDLVVKRTERF